MPKFIKNFQDWFSLKPKLDENNHRPPFVSERDLWWAHLGENIGTEISGKSNRYTRPVIVFRKLSNYTFLIIPTSTKIKSGSWFANFVHKNTNMMACLHQIKVIDYRRLQNKIGRIDIKDFKQIKNQFKKLYISSP